MSEIEEKTESFSLILAILAVSVVLTTIKNLAPMQWVASWDFISYLLLLVPLMLMIYTKEVKNSYAKWLVVPILVLIADTYYYNNTLVQELLPLVIYGTIGLLYIGSLQKMDYLFQVVLPKFSSSTGIFVTIKRLVQPIFSLKKYKDEMMGNSLYMRIGLALLITIPVFGVFLALFVSSDPSFGRFIEKLLYFKNPFESYHIFTIPMVFLFFILLFGYALSNTTSRKINLNSTPFDPLIIGIFLGALNFLFISFLFFQLSYIFGGEEYIANIGMSVATYARKGFFELATVMGIVLVIFLIVIYRYKNEKLIAILMSGLILQTIVMGYASLSKMHLYQSLMGATVLRYYVEWFDYFLLLILVMGIVYLFMRKPFYLMLNAVVVLGIVSFITISSINIDGIVAKQNIEQFKDNPKKLDRDMLSWLSLDALPYLKGTDIKIKIYPYHKRDCSKFNNYNIGYCSKLKEYGTSNIEFAELKRLREYE